jgi:methionyl-tRNA formyltransferase
MALRIIYLGSPDFAVSPLDLLLKKGYNIAAVVTVPDVAAGRGQKITFSPVKTYALQHHLTILQPQFLTDDAFLEQLLSLHADLQVVVAFRILPREVWSMPPLGTFNLHASLLPQYRGAAPINRVIMNGETVTGVTTFFLDDRIDTGQILFQESTTISLNETFGELHDRLMILGSELVLKTVMAIETGGYRLVDQKILISSDVPLTKAPKIQKEDCRINWQMEASAIHNMIRGLSPWPGANTELVSPANQHYPVKILRTTTDLLTTNQPTGNIITDGKNNAGVAVSDGIVRIIELQPSSRKRMTIAEFIRGFRLTPEWRVIL